jgi:tetratricopeptide (TPR) repeat protein
LIVYQCRDLMLPTPSYDLKNALDYARKFSLERKIFYIDSQMILLGILSTCTGQIHIDDADRENILLWINALDWPEGIIKRRFATRNSSVLLTQEADRMVNNAVFYQKKLEDKELDPEHIILSLLSIENRCQYKFQSLGIIFETYLEQVKLVKGKKMEVPFRSPQLKVPMGWIYNPFIRWFYGRTRKQSIVEKYFREAQALLQYNEGEKCRSICHHVLQIDPDHVNTLWLSGVSWRADRNFKKALPFYEKVLEKHRAHTGVISEIAYCYAELGNYAQAQQLYQYALSLNPGSPELLNSLGFNCIAMKLYIEAISYFDQAIAYDDAFAYAYNNKGYVLMQLGYLDPAKELIYKSLELNRGNAYAYRNLGLLYLQEKNVEAAKEMLETAKLYKFSRKYGDEVDMLLQQIKKTA